MSMSILDEGVGWKHNKKIKKSVKNLKTVKLIYFSFKIGSLAPSMANWPLLRSYVEILATPMPPWSFAMMAGPCHAVVGSWLLGLRSRFVIGNSFCWSLSFAGLESSKIKLEMLTLKQKMVKGRWSSWVWNAPCVTCMLILAESFLS